MADKNVKFVRIHGRLVPIRNKSSAAKAPVQVAKTEAAKTTRMGQAAAHLGGMAATFGAVSYAGFRFAKKTRNPYLAAGASSVGALGAVYGTLLGTVAAYGGARYAVRKAKASKPDIKASDVWAGAKSAFGASGTIYGAGKATQYALFKRSKRLSGIAEKYAGRPFPKIDGEWKIGKGGKRGKMLPPDMFDMAAFRKRESFWRAGQAKAKPWAARARKVLDYSRKAGKYALPAAAIGGAVVGIGAFVHARMKRRKDK